MFCKFRFAALIFAIASIFMTSPSFAGAALMPPPYGMGSYCNATSSDGRWALSYGPGEAWGHCNQVERYLNSTSSAPINAWYRGHYHMNATNSVLVQCNYFQTYFFGLGYLPLARAFRYAQGAGLSFCSFQVY